MALICSSRRKAIVAKANAPNAATPIQMRTRKIFGMEPQLLWPIRRRSAIANRLLRVRTGGWAVSGLPLALIGNASGQTFALRWISVRGVFDKEVRRKPLAFAADAWGYGI